MCIRDRYLAMNADCALAFLFNSNACNLTSTDVPLNPPNGCAKIIREDFMEYLSPFVPAAKIIKGGPATHPIATVFTGHFIISIVSTIATTQYCVPELAFMYMVIGSSGSSASNASICAQIRAVLSSSMRSPMNTIRLFTRNVNKSCSVPSGKGTTIGTVSGPFLTILLPGVAFTLRDVFLLFNHAIVVLARNFCLVVVSPETLDDIIDDAFFLLCAVVFVLVVRAEDDGDGAGVVGVGVRNIIPLFFFFFFDFWTYPRWCIQEDNNTVIGGVFLSQTDRQRNTRDDYSRVVRENNTTLSRRTKTLSLLLEEKS